MSEKVIKRGYVKWEDENGVFHKEPLADHPDLLANATAEQKIQAEEVRRLNGAAEEQILQAEIENESNAEEVLAELKAAPEDILTAAQLESTPETAPASGAEDEGEKTSEVESLQEPAAEPVFVAHANEPTNEHEEALADLYHSTTE